MRDRRRQRLGGSRDGLTRVRAAIALGALLLGGCGQSPNPAADARTAADPVEVRVSQVETRPWEQTLTVLGSLEAIDRSTLSIKTTGRLKTLLVDVGSSVKAGEVLAQIEPRDYELRVQQAAALLGQARVRLGLPLEGDDDTADEEKVSTVREARALWDEAKAGLERVKSLQAQNISSQAELERATAEYQVTFSRYQDSLQEARERRAILAQRRAEFDIARQQLNDTSMRAPFDGVVQQRLANVGEYLAAGTPVVSVVRVDPLRLRLDIPERQAPLVRVGQTVRVTSDNETNAHLGQIVRVSPALDERALMLRAEAELPNRGGLRPGALARAHIVVAESVPGLAIPADALITFAGTEKVLLAVTNAAVERRVATGRRQGAWIEVMGGLKEGDWVIRAPGGLSGGAKIRATPAPKNGASS